MLWNQPTPSPFPAVADLEVSLAAVGCNEIFSTQMRMLISFVTFHFRALWAARLPESNHAHSLAPCVFNNPGVCVYGFSVDQNIYQLNINRFNQSFFEFMRFFSLVNAHLGFDFLFIDTIVQSKRNNFIVSSPPPPS